MQKLKHSVALAPHKLCLALLTTLFAACFALAPTQEAQAGGFELEGQFGWLSNVASHDHHTASNHGFHFVLSPGYRFVDWVGLYLDQGFGGLFKGGSIFAGQTIVNAKFFLPINPVELWGKVGLGAFYVANDGHSNGAFAIKLGIGVTYDIKGPIGIGINFDYMPVIWNDGWYDYTTHVLDLGVHLRYKF